MIKRDHENVYNVTFTFNCLKDSFIKSNLHTITIEAKQKKPTKKKHVIAVTSLNSVHESAF